MPSVQRQSDQVHSGIFDEAREALSLFDGAPEVDGVSLTLEDYLAEQASYYRSAGTGAGSWLAAELQALADMARGLEAFTADAFDQRREVMESTRAEDLVDAGYRRGVEDGRRETQPDLF